MRYLLHILVAVVLVGCSGGPEAPPTRIKVTPAIKQPSAAEPVADARTLSDAADEHGAMARAHITEAHGEAEANVERIISLQGLVFSLREKGHAVAEDLRILQEKVDEQVAFITQLVGRLGRAQGELERERELRRQATSKLDEAAAKIAAKETEADQLRQQLSDADTHAQVLEGNAKKNHEKALAYKADVDRIKGHREILAWALGVVTLLLLISLVLNYVQFRKRFPLPI